MVHFIVSSTRCLLLFFTLVFMTKLVLTYRPVVLVHGLEIVIGLSRLRVHQSNFSSASGLTALKEMIQKAHPGTNVTIPDLYSGNDSLTPLWKQLPAFRQALEDVMSSAKDGINLVCYSQGGILCRALIANMSDHNVNTFISLSGPQMGQFGDTSFIPFLPKLKDDVYKVCYTNVGQNLCSVCNYWNDPHERSEYLKDNIFLPVLNNETYNNYSQVWKKNILRLNKMILIGGPDDGVITPWQSSHFGFYDDKEEVVEMEKQEVFMKDSFGLQTLYKRGGIRTHTISGVEHLQWPSNQTVFDCCIEPYLT